jgi:purine nucleosidase
MGGVFEQLGNVTPWAEFNVHCDPDALAQILDFDGIKKVLIPADIYREVTMDMGDFRHIEDESLSRAIRDIIREYVEYYRGEHVQGGFAGGVMYDTFIIAYMPWPELFNVEP